MNKRDRDNLNFILKAKPAVLRDWYNHITEDDIVYAFELIQIAQSELEIDLLEMTDDVKDCSIANQVLAKFRL
jgi:hypothetical protein